MQVRARRQLDRSKGLASSRLSIASKLEFLGRLALAGRFDEIGRRLIGRKSLRAINGALGEPPAREPRPGLIPPHPWRIAAFIHELGLSGAPMSLVELATELARRKLAHVQVLAPTEGPITVACRAAGLDVAIHGIQLRDLLTRRRWTTAVAHLADVMRPFTPDIVHANSVMTAPAVAAARHAGLPTLLNVREDSPDESLFGFLPQDVAVEAFQTLRTATETVFVSQASFEGWRRFFAADASHVITNALRGEEAAPGGRTCVRGRLGIADGTVLVLCVGSYCERKGQADLVDAIESLPNWVRTHVHVAMMGEAEPVYFADLRRRVRKLSTDRQSALSLLPAQTRTRPVLRRSRYFRLLLSQRELPARDHRGDASRTADYHHAGVRHRRTVEFGRSSVLPAGRYRGSGGKDRAPSRGSQLAIQPGTPRVSRLRATR